MIAEIMTGYIIAVAFNGQFRRVRTLPLRPVRSLCTQVGMSATTLRTTATGLGPSVIFYRMWESKVEMAA